MLQKMTDRVLICLPDGRWLALSTELFREALQNGAELATPPIGSPARETSSALVTADEIAEATHMSRSPSTISPRREYCLPCESGDAFDLTEKRS